MSITTHKETIVGDGLVIVTEEELKEYESEQWENLVHRIGKEIIEDSKEKIESRPCTIVFFPERDNDLKNLITKQNMFYQGKRIVSPLFTIKCDKNLEIELCKKGETRISIKMKYMIICC